MTAVGREVERADLSRAGTELGAFREEGAEEARLAVHHAHALDEWRSVVAECGGGNRPARREHRALLLPETTRPGDLVERVDDLLVIERHLVIDPLVVVV